MPSLSRPNALPGGTANSSTWTVQSVQKCLDSSIQPLRKFWIGFFTWTNDDLCRAAKITWDYFKVQDIFQNNKARYMMYSGPKLVNRKLAEDRLLATHPDLFLNRHGDDPPAWFINCLDSSGPEADTACAMQRFFQLARQVDVEERITTAKRSCARFDADDEDYRYRDFGHDQRSSIHRFSRRRRTTAGLLQTISPAASSISVRPASHHMATVAPPAPANNTMTSDLDDPMVMVFRISKRANELQFDLETYENMSDICKEGQANLAKLDDSITVKHGAYDMVWFSTDKHHMPMPIRNDSNLAVGLNRSSRSLLNLGGEYPIHLFIAINSAWIQQVPENLRGRHAVPDCMRVSLTNSSSRSSDQR